MKVYYNEIDAQKAHCLRQFISDGLIADGDVDERSIKEVRASDIRGYTQCHFFAGGGFWSYALRLAGWPDDRPVWTGSCPCPSFSAAGKGEGFEDPRHLWPDWFRLIRKCNPPTIFGEQVDRAIGYGWLDLIQSDLEAKDYALGTAVLGACSVGVPQRRQRLYFVAQSEHAERRAEYEEYSNAYGWDGFRRSGDAGGLELPGSIRRQRRQTPASEYINDRPTPGRQKSEHGVSFSSSHRTGHSNPGPVNGFWRDADWIRCTDGKFRAVRPGTQPLVNGAPARILRLRMYGDGIVPQVAAAFIKAYAG